MPREPIPRRAKAVKQAPTDYAALIQPTYQRSQVVGHRKREEEAKKKADEVAKATSTPKKKLTAKQRTGKPTYAKMIAKALIDLQERSGSSAAAIAKHIEANFGKNLPDNFKIFLRRAFKKAVEEDILEHEGARYRLSKSGKYKLGLKKRKKTSSSSSKKSSSKKRKSASSRSKSPKRSSSRSRSKSPSSEDEKKKKKSKSKKSSSSSSSSSKKSKSSSKSSSKAKEVKSTRSSRADRRSDSSASTSSSSSKNKTTPAGYVFVWQYQDAGKWQNYDSNASDVVEKAYQDYLKNPGMCDVRAVKSGQWQYQVDFLNNKQTNIQHENHTVRSIRRCPL